MLSLVYISRAEPRLTEANLFSLLEAARRKNLEIGITGLLLYKDGNFMQLLEGGEPVVRELFATISADLRHCNVTVLTEEPCTDRLFPSWSMGFQNLNSIDPKEVPGYSEFLNVPLTDAAFLAHPTKGQELLMLFKKIG